MSEQTYARVHASVRAHTHSHRVCGHLIYFRCFAQMSYKVLSVSVYLCALSVFVCVLCVCVFSRRDLITKLSFSSCSQNVMKLETNFHPEKLSELKSNKTVIVVRSF